MQSAVLQAGPVATDSHKAILWSMGLLRLSEPGQMFIQELRETGFGTQRLLKGPIHSHTTQQHSWPPVTASVTEGLYDLPIYAVLCPHLQSQSQEERRARSVGLPQVS